jgi:hypothetical protein
MNEDSDENHYVKSSVFFKSLLNIQYRRVKAMITLSTLVHQGWIFKY